MFKKIDVYVNGKYLWSTNKYRRCKDASSFAEKRLSDKVVRQAVRKKCDIHGRTTMKVVAHFDRG